jgi:hypothetical protein
MSLSSSSEETDKDLVEEKKIDEAFQKNVDALLQLKDAISQNVVLNESRRELSSPVKSALSGATLDDFFAKKIAEMSRSDNAAKNTSPVKDVPRRASSRAARRHTIPDPHLSDDTPEFRASVEPLKLAFIETPLSQMETSNSMGSKQSTQVTQQLGAMETAGPQSVDLSIGPAHLSASEKLQLTDSASPNSSRIQTSQLSAYSPSNQVSMDSNRGPFKSSEHSENSFVRKILTQTSNRWHCYFEVSGVLVVCI